MFLSDLNHQEIKPVLNHDPEAVAIKIVEMVRFLIY